MINPFLNFSSPFPLLLEHGGEVGHLALCEDEVGVGGHVALLQDRRPELGALCPGRNLEQALFLLMQFCFLCIHFSITDVHRWVQFLKAQVNHQIKGRDYNKQFKNSSVFPYKVGQVFPSTPPLLSLSIPFFFFLQKPVTMDL